MRLNPKWWLVAAGVLHIGLMLGETLPWEEPTIMSAVEAYWKKSHQLDDSLAGKEKRFVATIVHNAAIYNGIVGAALIAVAFARSPVKVVQVCLLSGVVVAGAAGGMTLTPTTWVQAGVGAIVLVIVLRSSTPNEVRYTGFQQGLP